jgi:isoquinoline 1-oxidoreductase
MTTPYTEEEQLRDLLESAKADEVEYRFEPTRRDFVQILGAGILIAAAISMPRSAQAGGAGRAGRGGLEGGIAGAAPTNLLARLHISKQGVITVLCGKVEGGQGARAEVTLAAAEELGLSPGTIACVMADTALTPNDGPTVGSRTTPSTVPLVRRAAAAAKHLLLSLAATALGVPAGELALDDSGITHRASGRKKTIAELAAAADFEETLRQTPLAGNVAISAVSQWKSLGRDFLRPNGRDIVTGKMTYPSDVRRPGMLYGKVLRAPGLKDSLAQADLARAKGMKDVIVVQDGEFVGVAAPSTFDAEKALDAIDARWRSAPHPASSELADYFRKNATIPANRFAAQMSAAAKALKATYFVPYIQHVPMEPRAALAEWNDGKLTVWTSTQQPWGVRSTLARTFNLNETDVRVVVNDFGGGFGGKHTGECAVEAARIARAAGKPILLRYTRDEEFTFAYFRPAGIIDCQGSVDAAGKISSWYFINVHSGPSAVQTPYAIASNQCANVNIPADIQPLRVGSYRGLAATANAWARECFMDELADAAGQDPLAFRLAHLQDARLRAVLESVAQRFDWSGRWSKKSSTRSVGIACAVEKASYTATAAEVSVDKESSFYKIEQIHHVFECGKILNPHGLMSQVHGAIIQGLGPILREEMIFENGRMQNGRFADYKVPRFADVPPLDVHLLDRPDLEPAGSGETPLISVAPAVTNAVSRALGVRLRSLPLKMSEG